MSGKRQSTGISALDKMLGGGLLPGTLTVVVGATGIGKTQLGVQYAHAGLAQEGKRGIFFDTTARGDSQNHPEYAKRLADWDLSVVDTEEQPILEPFFEAPPAGEYLHVFDYRGRRVTRRDLDWDDWQTWQAQLNSRLRSAIAFLYGHFIRGVQRVVLDGIEPADRPSESIQFHLLEYVYQQVLRKDFDWVARDLFREQYRKFETQVLAHPYLPASIGSLLLATSHETMLDELIRKPLSEGDILSNANTIILMGKQQQGNRVGRALQIAKHRGSYCDDQIVPYRVTETGIKLDF